MVIFLILLLVLKLSVGQDDCTPTTCSNHGPTIRFPFCLNNCQPQHCGYPVFDLSCSQNQRHSPIFCQSFDQLNKLRISIHSYHRPIWLFSSPASKPQLVFLTIPILRFRL
ncbi:hypothetical protein CsSME_00001960 [Camellia sinensis var. sinensis]